MILQSDTADFFKKVIDAFNPKNEFVYIGMLCIALIIAVILNGKRTARDIWNDMWPKLIFLGVIYIIVIFIIYITDTAPQ